MCYQVHVHAFGYASLPNINLLYNGSLQSIKNSFYWCYYICGYPVEKASVKLLAWVIMDNIAIDCYTVTRLVAGLLKYTEVLLGSKFNTTCTYMYVSKEY